MRILLVSQMYPGPTAPDLGVFVRGLEEQLVARGNEVERAVLDRRRRGKRKYLELARTTRRTARRFRPEVVYAHFLVPTGLIAALAGGAPLVVTAHGRDVRNVGWLPGIGAATRFVARRAAAIIAVSEYLRRELEAKVPEARGKTEVVDSDVDLERFTVQPAPTGPPRYLCIGSLIQRKNVARLASAFERLGEGTLTFVGDGPLRGRAPMRPRERPPRSTSSGVRRRRWRRFSSEPLEVRKPDLHERADRLFEARLARLLESPFVALAHLGRVDALLEAVVPGDEQLLDPLAGLVLCHAAAGA